MAFVLQPRSTPSSQLSVFFFPLVLIPGLLSFLFIRDQDIFFHLFVGSSRSIQPANPPPPQFYSLVGYLFVFLS